MFALTSSTNSLVPILFLLSFFLLVLSDNFAIADTAGVVIRNQRPLRAFPDDLTRVYYGEDQNQLLALPFESGQTSVDPFAVSPIDRVSFVNLKGAQAATVLMNNAPRFYVFIADRLDPPPHQLVRLQTKKNTRRLTIVSEKGSKGYSPLDDEAIALEYRILERLRIESSQGRYLFVNFMELHPRPRLVSGEYAIIGDSLKDIATFRIQ